MLLNMQGNKILIHTTTWINLENILKEKSKIFPSEETTITFIIVYRISETNQCWKKGEYKCFLSGTFGEPQCSY